MNGEVSRQVAALEHMTVGQLRDKYAEVFGEESRSGNRQWLLRRVAWRMQAIEASDLPERARQRATMRLLPSSSVRSAFHRGSVLLSVQSEVPAATIYASHRPESANHPSDTRRALQLARVGPGLSRL